jgi:HSP20 family protein
MAVIKMEPGKDLVSIKEKMNRIFEESISRSRAKGDLEAVSWSPPVDIYENEDCIVLRAEIPGMKKSDIDVQIHGDTLVLKGLRRRTRESPDENYLLLERSFGSFTRTFKLPRIVESEGVVANYKNGVLELILPKAKDVKPKKIRINP